MTKEIDGKKHGEIALDDEAEHCSILSCIVKQTFVLFSGRILEGKAVSRDVPVTDGDKNNRLLEKAVKLEERYEEEKNLPFPKSMLEINVVVLENSLFAVGTVSVQSRRDDRKAFLIATIKHLKSRLAIRALHFVKLGANERSNSHLISDLVAVAIDSESHLRKRKKSTGDVSIQA